MPKKIKKTKQKTFKLRKCPECGSNGVGVVVGNEEGKSKGEWECHKCKWVGNNIDESELNEEEFMKYLNDKSEDVS